MDSHYLSPASLVPQGHPQLHVCEQHENTQQARPTGVQQPRTGQTLGKETGKEEGTKRTQHALLSPATSHVTWNGRREGNKKGKETHQSALAKEEPSGGLQRLILPALGPEV